MRYLNRRGLLGPGLGKQSTRQPVAGGEEPVPETPTYWYDFSNIVGLWQDDELTSAVTTDGQTIAGVTNQGLATGNLVDDSLGPVYKTGGANGKSYAQYTRESEMLLSPVTPSSDISASLDTMWFIVIEYTDAGGTTYAFHDDTTALRYGLRFLAANDLPTSYASSINIAHGTATSDGTLVAVLCHHDISETKMFSRASNDATHREAANSGASFTDIGFRLGSYDNTGSWWDGKIYEFGFYNDADSTLPTLDALETYITSKYGVTWA